MKLTQKETHACDYLVYFIIAFRQTGVIQGSAQNACKDEQGKNIWEDQKTRVPNQELKSMVEAYKTRAPQPRDQRAADPRESAREKLDALVKDTASKLTSEKIPKAKSKIKKGPEL